MIEVLIDLLVIVVVGVLVGTLGGFIAQLVWRHQDNKTLRMIADMQRMEDNWKARLDKVSDK